MSKSSASWIVSCLAVLHLCHAIYAQQRKGLEAGFKSLGSHRGNEKLYSAISR